MAWVIERVVFLRYKLRCLDVNQGTAVRVEYGDAAVAADSTDAHVIGHAFPHTYGQPLAHFLPKTATVPDATVITEHPAVRYTSSRYGFVRGRSCGFISSVCAGN